jgi:hypothetical protein
MNGANRRVLESLLESLDEFLRGGMSVEEVQQSLQSTLELLEREAGDLSESIRLAEADLEEIRFTMLLDEQRPAAVVCLDPIRRAIAKRLNTDE